MGSKTSIAIANEIKLVIVSLISKIYLSKLSQLVTLPNFQVVWIQILRFMEQFMNAGLESSCKQLTETVLETCKNMLLVMQGCEMFDDTKSEKSSNDKKELWNLTSNLINGFCGKDFIQNLFPN